MANNGYKKAFDGLLQIYVSFDDSAETIVRRLKKMLTADTRSKLVGKLRSLDRTRLELLDQMDKLANSS